MKKVSSWLLYCVAIGMAVFAIGASPSVCLGAYAESEHYNSEGDAAAHAGIYQASAVSPDTLKTRGDNVQVTWAYAVPTRSFQAEVVTWTNEATAVETVEFAGRSTGWGCTYHVEGGYTNSTTTGNGYGQDRWYSKFHENMDEVRIVLEVNAYGPDDDYIPCGEDGTLTVGIQGGSGSTSYTVNLSADPSNTLAFSTTSVTLNGGDSTVVNLHALAVGKLKITGTCTGLDDAHIDSGVFRVTMGRIMKGTTEQTAPLVVGEDYSFEYTFEPSGITLPNLTFAIGYGISSSGYTAVHKAGLVGAVAGTHTETWSQTKWTADHVGAYANPQNGTYGAFCTYTINGTEHRICEPKNFTTQLVIEATLNDAAPSGEISSGLYQPDYKPLIGSSQIQIGLKPQSGNPIFGSKDSLTFDNSKKIMQDMDHDSTSGNEQGYEVEEVVAKQIMQNVDAGDYKVVIQGLRDVAGNDGPGGTEGVVSDWALQLE